MEKVALYLRAHEDPEGYVDRVIDIAIRTNDQSAENAAEEKRLIEQLRKNMTTPDQNPRDFATKAKTTMIIDMATDFSGMTRVFGEGSKPKIDAKIAELFLRLNGVQNQRQYDELHADFCSWFIQNIHTAQKEKKDGTIIKLAGPSSWGQAAKVLDITAKVFAYYCGLPTPDQSEVLLPLLHGAIDNQILEDLKKRFSEARIRCSSLADMDRADYDILQNLIARDIREEFNSEIYKVQYDDILFLRLNR